MNIKRTPLQDAFIIEPKPFVDTRGKFSRVFCQNELCDILDGKNIVQINQSLTCHKGAIRGMHFQYPPMAEIKMVRCITGEVYDVMVDLRKNSPTFLKWHGEILSSENMKMMYVPKGFAHGFQALEENSEIIYFVTEFYSPEHEEGVRYSDPLINIQWPLKITDISEKDKKHSLLRQDFSGITDLKV
ncbi:MAG: dTDP-4-dehydrorhamnose 3,5-epimerase [Pseudomonadota bacterium]